MKIQTLAVALVASAALVAPADAAPKKQKKQVYRAPAYETYSAARPHPHDVWFSNDYVGRDPDPNIRSFMMRNPRIYDGTL
jgi:hypothetical protein